MSGWALAPQARFPMFQRERRGRGAHPYGHREECPYLAVSQLRLGWSENQGAGGCDLETGALLEEKVGESCLLISPFWVSRSHTKHPFQALCTLPSGSYPASCCRGQHMLLCARAQEGMILLQSTILLPGTQPELHFGNSPPLWVSRPLFYCTLRPFLQKDPNSLSF